MNSFSRQAFNDENADKIQFYANNHLLAIGIDKYKHITNLNNPVRDIEIICDILEKDYFFKPENTIKLYNEDATEEKIRQALFSFGKKISSQENLIVLFSGHGYYEEAFNLGYWMPVDARPNDTSTYISTADIAYIAKEIKSHHTLLIVDSCFSGSLLTQLRSETHAETFPSCRVFASGRVELVEDGPIGEHSPFAKGIINFLNNNAAKATKITKLIEYVKEYVEEKTQKRQNPVDGRLPNDGHGEFVLHKRVTEEDLWEKIRKNKNVADIKYYKKEFPKGKFTEQLNALLEIIEHDDQCWENAIRKGTYVDFQDYLNQYPEGRHLDKAKEYIQQYLDDINDKRKNLEEAQNKLTEIERIRVKYKNLINQAEVLFKNKKYIASRRQYFEARKNYIEGINLIPDDNHVSDMINKCMEMITYFEYISAGEKLYINKNYKSALDAFQKAATIKKTPRLLRSIELCKSSLKSSKKLSINPLSSPPPEKKSIIIVHSQPPFSTPKTPPPPLPGGKPLSFYIVLFFVILTILFAILLIISEV